MTVLLTITILILTGVAIWQITKIFELSKLGQKRDDSQIAVSYTHLTLPTNREV